MYHVTTCYNTIFLTNLTVWLFVCIVFALYCNLVSSQVTPAFLQAGLLPGISHKDLQVVSHRYLTDGPGGTCQSFLHHSQGDPQQSAASLLDYKYRPPAAGLGIRTFS